MLRYQSMSAFEKLRRSIEHTGQGQFRAGSALAYRPCALENSSYPWRLSTSTTSALSTNTACKPVEPLAM